MMHRVLIITNGGDITSAVIQQYKSQCDTIIACDGGLQFALDAGVLPDYLIGDLDSYVGELPAEVKESVEVIRFPVEKDDSDTALAIEFAKEHGAKEIFLLGAWGDRADHTLSHIFFLKRERDKGNLLVLKGVQNEVRWVKAGDVITVQTEYPYISIIPMTENGLRYSTKGFYYEVKELFLECGSTRGISNELIGSQGEVFIHEGEGLLIYAADGCAIDK